MFGCVSLSDGTAQVKQKKAMASTSASIDQLDQATWPQTAWRFPRSIVVEYTEEIDQNLSGAVDLATCPRATRDHPAQVHRLGLHPVLDDQVNDGMRKLVVRGRDRAEAR